MAQALKEIYTQDYVLKLADALRQASVKVTDKELCDAVFLIDWDSLELKARTTRLREAVHSVMNCPFPKACQVLMRAGENFGGHEGMFFPEYVSAYGLEHWPEAMNTLEVLTTYSSAEFAIRPFIEKFPEKTMAKMEAWSSSDNEHVRRLSSEGARPRLPWASALKEFKRDPQALLPILENLKADESLYVRKSVANCLNDISKDHPELTLKLAKRWLQNKNHHTTWIVKHGLRTLLKGGNNEALSAIGYGGKGSFLLGTTFLETPFVEMGGELSFSFDFEVKKESKVRLEYALHFIRKNGQHNKKVFKISEGQYEKGEYIVEKKHGLKKINTRSYYEGVQFLEIIINGIGLKHFPFYLTFKKSPYYLYMFLTEKMTIYTGITTDLNRRYLEHREGKLGAKYTKANKPETLIYLEAHPNRSEAQKREAAVKKLSRPKKEALSWFKLLK